MRLSIYIYENVKHKFCTQHSIYMIVVVDAAMLQISVVVVAQGLPLSVWSDVWSGNIRRWLADWGSCYEAGRGDPLSQQHHHHHHHYRSAAYNHHQYVEVMVRRCASRTGLYIFTSVQYRNDL